MFKHILVPVDGSPTSQLAVEKAIGLAKVFGSRVSAIFVIDPYPFTGIGTDFAYGQAEYLSAATAEANAAISVSKLGKPGWAKNIPKSDVTKQKIRDSLTGTTRSKESVLKSAAAITGKKHPRYNHTIYAFQLNDNLIEYCTQNEIITKYNLNKGAVSAIIHGDRLSFKGWRMVLS